MVLRRLFVGLLALALTISLFALPMLVSEPTPTSVATPEQVAEVRPVAPLTEADILHYLSLTLEQVRGPTPRLTVALTG